MKLFKVLVSKPSVVKLSILFWDETFAIDIWECLDKTTFNSLLRWDLSFPQSKKPSIATTFNSLLRWDFESYFEIALESVAFNSLLRWDYDNVGTLIASDTVFQFSSEMRLYEQTCRSTASIYYFQFSSEMRPLLFTSDVFGDICFQFSSEMRHRETISRTQSYWKCFQFSSEMRLPDGLGWNSSNLSLSGEENSACSNLSSWKVVRSRGDAEFSQRLERELKTSYRRRTIWI